MNRQRAEQIAESPDMKTVLYNGKQVYIQHVDEQNDTARIYALDDPQNEFEVELAMLTEK